MVLLLAREEREAREGRRLSAVAVVSCKAILSEKALGLSVVYG
jgi:hypothetical protein